MDKLGLTLGPQHPESLSFPVTPSLGAVLYVAPGSCPQMGQAAPCPWQLG